MKDKWELLGESVVESISWRRKSLAKRRIECHGMGNESLSVWLELGGQQRRVKGGWEQGENKRKSVMRLEGS